MNVLPHNAPRQLAHVHSAEEGSTDTAEDERRHGDAAEDERLEITCSTIPPAPRDTAADDSHHDPRGSAADERHREYRHEHR